MRRRITDYNCVLILGITAARYSYGLPHLISCYDAAGTGAAFVFAQGSGDGAGYVDTCGGPYGFSFREGDGRGSSDAVYGDAYAPTLIDRFREVR